MRTLLDEALPPYCSNEETFSAPESKTPRTFSEDAVLAHLDNLVEVGLGGIVMATPGAGAKEAKPALGRGMALSAAANVSSNGNVHASLSLADSVEATSVV